MREFRIDLSEHLYRGLRPDARSGRVGRFLLSVENVEIGPFGAMSPEAYLNPVEETMGEVDFPWPQLLVGQSQNLLGFADEVLLLDPAWVPYEVSWVDRDGNPVNLQSTGVWDYVDLGESWILTNGSSVLMRHGLGQFTAHATPYIMVNDFQINALAYHRGRIISGGFQASGWNNFWAQILGEFPRNQVEELELNLKGLNEKTVLWSSIGGGDFPFWLFYPTGAAFQFDSAMFLDRIRRNEWGFFEVPWQGSVLKILPAQERVVVYGSEGIVEMVLSAGTYAIRPISRIGVPSRGAAGGDENVQCFLGTDGALYLWQAEKGVIRLGFEEYLEGLVLQEILILKEERIPRFLICSSDGTFILNLEGEAPALGWTSAVHTSLAFQSGAEVAVSSVFEDARFRVRTTPFKLPGPGFARLNGVHVQAELSDTLDNQLKVTVYYRGATGGEWAKGPTAFLNKEGNAVLRAQGAEFMLEVEAVNPGFVKLERLEATWHGTDKRFSRGPSAQNSDGA